MDKVVPFFHWPTNFEVSFLPLGVALLGIAFLDPKLLMLARESELDREARAVGGIWLNGFAGGPDLD